MLTSTFTIAARCERTGQLGIATSTAIPAGGAICPFVSPDGAISTQSFNNYYFGIDGLALLAAGRAAGAVLDTLLAGDPERELRQLIVVDRDGNAAAYTGQGCVPARGHRTARNMAVGGNMLADESVLNAMQATFEAVDGADLIERLMATLEAGQAAGGDRRGRQSAALKVLGTTLVPVCDLRVDEHSEPVAELRRILGVARRELMPFLAAMPTRERPAGSLSPGLAAFLTRPVAVRALIADADLP